MIQESEKKPKIALCRRCYGTGKAHDKDSGEIKVTKKMKCFFWAMYLKTTGSFGRKKNGERRNDKRTVQLSTEAEFWKHMALMKEGKSIKIPRRRFLGASPEVEQAVKDIIEENLADYFEHEYKLK